VSADTLSDDGRLVLDGANVSFWTVWPDKGELIDPARSRLLELLVDAAPGTRSFFYWGLALIASGDRPCLLRGSIETFAREEALIREEFELVGVPGPEMIWPEDRSFLVVSGYDLASTCVGCSQALADQIVSDDILEAVDTDLGSRVDWGSDQLNLPTPATPTN
jgi:hypothetical protein